MALSFFDTIIDEILLFDTHGQFIQKKEQIVVSSLVDTRAVEEVETRDVSKNMELFSFLQDTEIIFMYLDFWEQLREVAKTCQKSIIFAGSTVNNHTDLGIKEAKISSLQELESIVKNFGKSVYFYTKHTKVLLNFLEYNNLVS